MPYFIQALLMQYALFWNQPGSVFSSATSVQVDNISSVLASLQRLPVCFRIDFNILFLVFKFLEF